MIQKNMSPSYEIAYEKQGYESHLVCQVRVCCRLRRDLYDDYSTFEVDRPNCRDP